MAMATQSLEDVMRLFDEFRLGGFASPDLIFSERNSAAILKYVLDKYRWSRSVICRRLTECWLLNLNA
jgi:hypothetical protein